MKGAWVASGLGRLRSGAKEGWEREGIAGPSDKPRGQTHHTLGSLPQWGLPLLRLEMGWEAQVAVGRAGAVGVAGAGAGWADDWVRRLPGVAGWG